MLLIDCSDCLIFLDSLFRFSPSGVVYELMEAIATPAALASDSAENWYRLLPLDYLETYLEKVQSVTVADLSRLAKVYLSPLFAPPSFSSSLPVSSTSSSSAAGATSSSVTSLHASSAPAASLSSFSSLSSQTNINNIGPRLVIVCGPDRVIEVKTGFQKMGLSLCAVESLDLFFSLSF